MTPSLCKTLAALALSGFILHGPASAEVLFTASGTWDADAELSSLSAPAASWAFSFSLPDVVANPSDAPASFSYSLAGTPLLLSPQGIAFFTSGDSGMFDILLPNAAAFSLYGDVVLSGSTLSLGSYTVYAGLDGGLPMGSGMLTLQAVPEPASAASLALGLAALGLLALRSRPAQGPAGR